MFLHREQEKALPAQANGHIQASSSSCQGAQAEGAQHLFGLVCWCQPCLQSCDDCSACSGSKLLLWGMAKWGWPGVPSADTERWSSAITRLQRNKLH